MSVETAEFWMDAPRYLQQVGEAEPRLVPAAPGHPVRVRLPAKIKRGDSWVDQPEDAHLKRIKADGPAPKAPVDVRPKVEKSTSKPAPAPEMTKKL